MFFHFHLLISDDQVGDVVDWSETETLRHADIPFKKNADIPLKMLAKMVLNDALAVHFWACRLQISL